MNTDERKAHWENVFETKDTRKVSWYQSNPATSLKLIEKLNISKTSKIIEVGSGDSYLGDYLLQKGYSNITLLDISEKALSTIKSRLGEQAKKIKFLAKDITAYSSPKDYKLWHDRAVFHFLTDKADIEKYVQNVSKSVAPKGYLIIGTFSNNGPKMCSDLKVCQYSERELIETFEQNFTAIECFNENHTTPSGGSQNFAFCILQRK